MELVTIHGGPRKQGNTATVLGWLEAAAREAGHSVTRFDLYDLSVGGCRGCYACAGTADEPGCVLKDDVGTILDAVVRASGVVYASPLYMWGLAGPLKTLLDRSMCLVKDYLGPHYASLVDGTRAGLLVTCMGPIPENADLLEPQFRRFATYAKLDAVPPWILAGCSEPDALDSALASQAADWMRELLPG